VQKGAFGQHMHIELVNDGPVTIAIDSIRDEKERKKLENVQKRLAKEQAQRDQKGLKKPENVNWEESKEESKEEESKEEVK